MTSRRLEHAPAWNSSGTAAGKNQTTDWEATRVLRHTRSPLTESSFSASEISALAFQDYFGILLTVYHASLCSKISPSSAISFPVLIS